MGCDIHPELEVRSPRTGLWHHHYPRTPDPYAQYRAGNGPKYGLLRGFASRNYLKFSVLSGVRSDGNVKPIEGWDGDSITGRSGLPYDMSPRNVKAFAEDQIDHSPGYVTLQELLDYPWHENIEAARYISEYDYLAWKIKGIEPTTEYGWTPGAVHVGEDEYLELFSVNPATTTTARSNAATYVVAAKWGYSIIELIPEMTSDILPYMTELIPKGGTPADVRMLFYYDS